MKFDRKRFFGDYRVRFGPIKQVQVDGLSFLLDQIERDAQFTMVRSVAYLLATVKGETGTYQPRREIRADAIKNPKLFKLQERYWPTGFFGRGYVQITWEKNYRLAGEKLAGLQVVVTEGAAPITIQPNTFTRQPNHVMVPTISYLIASRGMREGWFTGKKLGDFIKEGLPPDYRNARRVINGIDRADEFAGFANKFELLLRASKLD